MTFFQAKKKLSQIRLIFGLGIELGLLSDVFDVKMKVASHNNKDHGTRQ